MPYLNLVCIYRGILIHVVSHLHSPILLKFVRMGGIQKRKFSIWAEIILPFIWNQSACLLVFSIWVFFHEHSRFTGHQGKGEGMMISNVFWYENGGKNGIWALSHFSSKTSPKNLVLGSSGTSFMHMTVNNIAGFRPETLL